MKMDKKRENCSDTQISTEMRGPERDILAARIYYNLHFMQAVTGHIGNLIRIHTQNGSVFEGVFRTFSNQFEIVLELAHKVDAKSPERIDVKTVIEKLIFKPQVIITIEARDVDLEFATKSTFKIDTEISKFKGNVDETDLIPWDSSGCNGDDCDLGCASGWDANDMFKRNEQIYGIKSTFDHSLRGYTTRIQKQDTKDYRDAEAKAIKIAREIENNSASNSRVAVENCDEEEKFAAVTRPSGRHKNVTDTPTSVPYSKKKNTGKPGEIVQATPSATNLTNAQKPRPQDNNKNHTVAADTTVVSINEEEPPVSRIPSPDASVQTGRNNLSSLSRDNTDQRGGRGYLSPPMKPQRQITNSLFRSGRGYNITDKYSRSQRTWHNAVGSQVNPRSFGNMDLNLYPSSGSTRFSTSDIKIPANQMINSPPSHRHRHFFPQKLSHVAPRHSVMAPFFHVQTSKAVSTQGSLSVPATSHSLPLVSHHIDHRSSRDDDNQSNIILKQSVPNQFPGSTRARDEQQKNTYSSDVKLVRRNHDEGEKNVQEPNELKSKEVEVSSSTIKEQPIPDASKVETVVQKSKLNPNAKEFVYSGPSLQRFPLRPPSTRPPSNLHMPPTTSYRPAPGRPTPTIDMPATFPAPTAMPPPAYNTPTNQGTSMSHRPDIPSIASVTGQSVPMPMQRPFTMPFSTQAHIAAQSYHQMVSIANQQPRSGIVPLVSPPFYHHNSQNLQATQVQCMSPTDMHPLPYRVSSPGQTGGQIFQGSPGHSGGHNTTSGYYQTPQSPPNGGSYLHMPPPPLQRPYPLNQPPSHILPMLPSPPPPSPQNPYMMGAQGNIQQYVHQQQVDNQQNHGIQVVILRSQ